MQQVNFLTCQMFTCGPIAQLQLYNHLSWHGVRPVEGNRRYYILRADMVPRVKEPFDRNNIHTEQHHAPGISSGIRYVELLPDSNEGWPNVGPTSVLSSRRWANVSPTYIAVWDLTLVLVSLLRYDIVFARLHADGSAVFMVERIAKTSDHFIVIQGPKLKDIDS